MVPRLSEIGMALLIFLWFMLILSALIIRAMGDIAEKILKELGIEVDDRESLDHS